MEYTSERIADIAGRVLRDPLATEDAKALAGSTLTRGGELVHVVFRDEDNSPDVEFVEVQTPDGKSISVPWHYREDGYKELRLYTSSLSSTPADAGWKEAAIAWNMCASIHLQYCKGKDPFFTTRQADFIKHIADARDQQQRGGAVGRLWFDLDKNAFVETFPSARGLKNGALIYASPQPK